jgi:hypothetical protein
MLGQKIIDYKKPFIYAEGRAAQKNENIQQTASKKRAGSSGKSLRINSKVMEGNVDLMP